MGLFNKADKASTEALSKRGESHLAPRTFNMTIGGLEKALLKEFETYRSFTGRKIKESRLEVLRAGFRAAWAAKDYQTIIGIANKLPEETLQEDEKLLTLYDMALTRTEDGL